MEVFFGVSTPDGIGIGPAFLIPAIEKRNQANLKISKEKIAADWTRFENALEVVVKDISEKLENISKDSPFCIQREILEAYVMFLSDFVFIKEVRDFFEAEQFNIEYAVNFKTEEYAARLRAAGDAYLSERAKDITDIFGMVLDEMIGIRPFDVSQIPHGSVVVAASLSPTDMIAISKRNVAGIALSEGGVSSHAAILARNYGIPAVLGLDACDMKGKIKGGETAIVDTEHGKLVVAPEPKTLLEYREKVRKEAESSESLKKYLGRHAETSDGVQFALYANIGTPEEAENAEGEGADGIGLFRTEFLFMSRADSSLRESKTKLDEDAQFDAYRRVLKVMNGKPVTIRTFDIGGDKLVHSADVPTFEEKNPLMGIRAIRLCLAYPNFLKTQLRALYRASVHGNLKIMFPLITSAEEVRQCLALASAVREELSEERIAFKADVPIGIMIETAAAALCADELAGLCDFFSLGTNDLTQYTLCVDRENAAVSEMYNDLHPAVLKLIAMTAQSAQAHGIPISVCGEMAGREEGALILGGMGIRNLSMSPKCIAKVKHLISKSTIAEMQKIAAEKSVRT